MQTEIFNLNPNLNLARFSVPARLVRLGLCVGSCLLAAAPGAALADGPAHAAGAASASARAGGSRASGAVAGATEFEVVAAGDELYRLLSIVQRGGLLASAPRSGSTRYELALETGRAALSLASRRAANARVGEDAARALSDLLARLRPELRRLDVDVDAALSLCQVGAAAGSQAPVSVLLSSAPGAASSGAASAPGAGGRRPGGLGAGSAAPGLRSREMSLSSRLRIEAAQASRARSLGDPFGGEVGIGPSIFGAGASNRAGAAFFDRPKAGPHSVYGAQGVSLGASLDVSDALRLRAGFGSVAPSSGPSGLRALGGADTDWLSLGGSRYTSAAVGARVSAFNDRLGMSVNWARLMPEERDRVNQSIASFGVGLGPDRFKLQLQYQQLFGPSPSQPSRVIAGGVNISF